VTYQPNDNLRNIVFIKFIKMPDQKPDKSEANIIVLTDPWVTSGKYRKGVSSGLLTMA